MTDKQIRGLSWAMVTAVVSGVAVFANSLVVAGMDPLVHTSVKNGLVGLMIAGVLGMSGQWRQIFQLNKKQLGQLVAISIVGGSVPFGLFFTGLKMIGGVQGALIHKTLILWIALMAVPLLKEKVSWKMGAGIVLLYGSSLGLGMGDFSALTGGHVLVLMATILWAVENIMAKVVLRSVEPNVVVGARMGLGSIWLSGMLLATGKANMVTELSITQWGQLLVVAVLLFAYVMSWYKALKLAPATQVAGVLVGATVITNVLNVVWVTHALKLTQVVQAGLIVTGVYLVLMAAMDEIKSKKSSKLSWGYDSSGE